MWAMRGVRCWCLSSLIVRGCLPQYSRGGATPPDLGGYHRRPFYKGRSGTSTSLVFSVTTEVKIRCLRKVITVGVRLGETLDELLSCARTVSDAHGVPLLNKEMGRTE